MTYVGAGGAAWKNFGLLQPRKRVKERGPPHTAGTVSAQPISRKAKQHVMRSAAARLCCRAWQERQHRRIGFGSHAEAEQCACAVPGRHQPAPGRRRASRGLRRPALRRVPPGRRVSHQQQFEVVPQPFAARPPLNKNSCAGRRHHPQPAQRKNFEVWQKQPFRGVLCRREHA